MSRDAIRVPMVVLDGATHLYCIQECASVRISPFRPIEGRKNSAASSHVTWA